MECCFCKLDIPKNQELPLDSLLLCQITKYKFLSELVKIENESHCVQAFAHALKYNKEPFEGRGGILESIGKVLGLHSYMKDK